MARQIAAGGSASACSRPDTPVGALSICSPSRARDSASSPASAESSATTRTRALGAEGPALIALGSSNQKWCGRLGALEADSPAALGHDLVAQREAETRATDLARVRGVRAEELREDLRLLSGRDAQARVAHADAGEALIRTRRERHRSAARRILDRVGEQVGDHLADAIAIPDQRERMTRRGELEPVTRGLRREDVHLVLQEIIQVERFEREREAPGLQPLQIEVVGSARSGAAPRRRSSPGSDGMCPRRGHGAAAAAANPRTAVGRVRSSCDTVATSSSSPVRPRARR